MAEKHLQSDGIRDLISEENPGQLPNIRKYFDLNHKEHSDIVGLICRSRYHQKSKTYDPINSKIDSYILNLESLTVYVKEVEESLDINEFMSWMYLRKRKTHVLLIDESDILKDSSIEIYENYKDNYPKSLIDSEEFIALSTDRRRLDKYRQYNTFTTQFRLLSRGYLSGPVLVPIIGFEDKILESHYSSTWLLQVDIAQQTEDIKVINIPLSTRIQDINPAFLEYATNELRDYFIPISKELCNISQKNIKKSNLLWNTKLKVSVQGNIDIEIIEEQSSLPLISIIIPFRDQSELLEQCIKSLKRSEKICKYEIILANNGSVEDETRILIEKLIQENGTLMQHIYIDEEFNFSRINNIAAESANGEFILLLNNDIVFESKNPIFEMLKYFIFPEIGAVGTRLLYEDNSIQHQGIVITPFELYDTFSPYKLTKEEEYDVTYASLICTDNWSVATAACLLIKKEVWDKQNGLDESLTVAYNDVDFCLRLIEESLQIVVTPQNKIYHLESKSRGDDMKGKKYNRLYEEAGKLRKLRNSSYEKRDNYYPYLLSVSNPRCTPSIFERAEPLNEMTPIDIINIKEYLKEDSINKQHICIYVGYTNSIEIRPDVINQLREIHSYYKIVFVIVGPKSLESITNIDEISRYCSSIILRENIGYDFGSWRCGIMKYLDQIKKCESLLLMNDSMYGPLTPLFTILERTINSDSDITYDTKSSWWTTCTKLLCKL